MAKCIGTIGDRQVGCRRDIKPNEIKLAHAMKNDAGQTVGMLHHKCWHVARKQDRMGENGRVGEPPTAYEMSAQRVTANDLTAEAIATKERAEQAYAEAALRRRELLARVLAGDSQGGTSADAGLTLQQLLDQSDAEIERLDEARLLAERQVEIATERAKEDDRIGFTDWRDPTEAEI